MIKVKVAGLAELQRNLKDMPKRAQRAYVEGLRAEMGMVMNKAQETVPVITGRLRASAFIEDRKVNQHSANMEMGYRAPYAMRVHQNPFSRGWQWFATAFNEVASGSTRRIADRIAAALRRKR